MFVRVSLCVVCCRVLFVLVGCFVLCVRRCELFVVVCRLSFFECRLVCVVIFVV